MSDPSELPTVSVIVATRNRSERLRSAIAALERHDYPAERMELLVIDNRSTDDTAAVAAAAIRGFGARARLVREWQLGLSAARNAGVRSARGEIVAFLDDDAEPVPGWLAALARSLAEPGVLAAGGPVSPRYEGELPGWFPDRFLPYLSAWDLGQEALVLHYNEYPRGVNLALRREVFERFGWFSRQLGRRGGRLRSCEEVELCLRLERGGGEIVYVPQARVEHSVPVDRLSESWLEERCRCQGSSEAIVEWCHAGLAGLRAGRRRHRAHARAAESENPPCPLALRCQRAALLGYQRLSLLAPLFVPRYRRDRTGKPALPWLPFA